MAESQWISQSHLGQRMPLGQHGLHSRQNWLRLFRRTGLHLRHALSLLLNGCLYLNQGPIQAHVVHARRDVKRIVQLCLQTSGDRIGWHNATSIESLDLSCAAIGKL